MILLRCPKFLCRLRRLPFFLRRKKGRKERRQNQGFGILSADGVLPASVPFRRANGNEQISFLAFALPLRLHPLAAHAGPRCPGTAGMPSLSTARAHAPNPISLPTKKSTGPYAPPYACQNASQSSRPQTRKVTIIFSRDLCVRENTSQAASVEFCRVRQNYARSRL